LIGPKGAGKRTLFECISRLYDPGAGSMVFDGRPLANFVGQELAYLGIARDCFKRPALI
jgi:branched-chain amino acid transport system ATP-binding protein